MSEIDKMKRYIELTKLNENDRFYLDTAETLELVKHSSGSLEAQFKAFALAFNYGKAKGYRAAKAEVRR